VYHVAQTGINLSSSAEAATGSCPRRAWDPGFEEIADTKALYCSVGAVVAAFSDLTAQPNGSQVGKGRDALAQVVERRKLARPPDLARTVGWRLEPALDVFVHRFRS
jgi:hypothetical protein